uniref:Uncharacterized protein n=1 Tax=Ralstonia syzygii R24 TaxID=907261 RepID=G2ZZM2_9RALS|nr:hypothetical protein RALSY_10299 [Ralstonia syzygii R24]
MTAPPCEEARPTGIVTDSRAPPEYPSKSLGALGHIRVHRAPESASEIPPALLQSAA